MKDKSGKPGTPRRGGTPRSSRGSTPRASSPPLRLTSPANRVVSPTHQRITSPQGRGTPPVIETPGSVDRGRPGSGSRKSPPSKPMSPPPQAIPEYKPSTAPGKMTGMNDKIWVATCDFPTMWDFDECRQTSLCSLLLNLETPNDIRSVHCVA